jgi:hypothetical protein
MDKCTRLVLLQRELDDVAYSLDESWNEEMEKRYEELYDEICKELGRKNESK